MATMDSFTTVFVPGGRDVLLFQVAFALPAAYREITDAQQSGGFGPGDAVSAAVDVGIQFALTGWALRITRPLTLPGGERTRDVQGAVAGFIYVLRLSEGEVDGSRLNTAAWDALLYSIPVAHLASIRFASGDAAQALRDKLK